MKFLRQIRVAKPCHENWDEMSGAEQSKFCDKCCKSVHNLTEMTRVEAAELIATAPTTPCIRYTPDETGAPIFKGTRAWRNLMAAGAVGVIAASGCSPAPTNPAKTPTKTPVKSGPKPQQNPVMGDIAAPPIMGKVVAPAMLGEMAVAPPKKAAKRSKNPAADM